jgi:hypothetical protein
MFCPGPRVRGVVLLQSDPTARAKEPSVVLVSVTVGAVVPLKWEVEPTVLEAPMKLSTMMAEEYLL